ncbi:unnamed protein product [Calypogeia fissa]
MSYSELYHGGEPVTWRSYGRSNYLYESDPYHSDAVVLHVPMCCEKCVQKVSKSLKTFIDLDSVDIDVRRQRVIVRGDVDPERILRKVQKQISTATYWDNSYDYASYSSTAYESSRPTVSYNKYKYYGRRPSDDYEDYSAGAYDYHRPTVIIDPDYDYYNRSSAYEYHDGYPSSSKYSRHSNYTYSYPSYFEYPRHHVKSYDAHRYR